MADTNKSSGGKYINNYRVLPANEIEVLADRIIADSKKVQDEVANLKEGTQTWENSVLTLALDEAVSTSLSSHCTFPAYVSPDEAIRKASVEATKKLEEFEIESNMREDVYQSLLAYKKKGEKLGPEETRLLSKLLEGFERNGLGLDKASGKREQLLEKKKRVSELCINFQNNLTEDKTSLKFTREQLKGMPEDWLSNLDKDKDDPNLYIVTLKYPDRFPVFENCQVEATRKAMEIATSRQCMEQNVPILEEVIKLRHQMAQLLGKPTHADFILDVRMAKSNQTVRDFLQELRNLLLPYGLAEMEKLKQLKLKDSNLPVGSNVGIYAWDWRFYNKKLLVEEYQVDEEAIKQYFPLETVTQGLLFIYEKILNLKFELQTSVPANNLWHEDVTLYAVYDRTSSQFLGSFYLDLFPRDGKYGHAAAFPLDPTYLDQNKTRHYPCAAMVANFSKPGKKEGNEPGKPSLLKHDEVVTYFHEFGHIMHNICSTVSYARFAGTSVERDFVEAPSQMLENWCWEPEILEILSGHHERKDEKLPEALRLNMMRAKNVNTGLLNLRQVFFGLFDNTIHTREETNTGELWSKLRREVTLIEDEEGGVGENEKGNPAGSFGHLVGGYDAQYYGYLYSEVFSADMYKMFKDGGILNEDLGRKYREVILSRGGSVDSIDSLRQFLGREPNNKAFLEHLGLKAEQK
eukprot:TRINITY_DN25510_c0_g1_i1.p1 TRINITY_DN25510_c0_g1~~TRINITY_DN25510_c0_g1_i1.p1  ORF type:complete len:691 (-),score=194.17 TRINITY_DN25510_c0_g1_i1:13-2085(-)